MELFPKYRLGDRVIYTSEDDWDGKELTGKHGSVVSSADGELGLIGVQFDEDIDGHDCDGKGKYRHCWFVPRRHIAPEDSQFDPATEEELFGFLMGGD